MTLDGFATMYNLWLSGTAKAASLGAIALGVMNKEPNMIYAGAAGLAVDDFLCKYANMDMVYGSHNTLSSQFRTVQETADSALDHIHGVDKKLDNLVSQPAEDGTPVELFEDNN